MKLQTQELEEEEAFPQALLTTLFPLPTLIKAGWFNVHSHR
jgi:hypothetical protein